MVSDTILLSEPFHVIIVAIASIKYDYNNFDMVQTQIVLIYKFRRPFMLKAEVPFWLEFHSLPIGGISPEPATFSTRFSHPPT